MKACGLERGGAGDAGARSLQGDAHLPSALGDLPRSVGELSGCDADGLSGVTQASKDITKELKSMSVDEIRGGSDRYKELVAARDLEDALYGNG